MATKSTKQIPAERKPFYALAGAGEFAVGKLRTLPVQLSGELAKVPARLQKVPAELRTLPVQLQKVPAQVQSLPKQATSARATAMSVYTDLATRGEKAIASLRGTGRASSAKKTASSSSAKAS